MSHVPHEEPHPVFNRFQGANRSHRRNHPCYNPQIHMFSTVWVSLASSNPSSLPRDANTLLRYPSTWQIRLLAGWLAELRAERWSRFSRSDYRLPLIVSVDLGEIHLTHYPTMALSVCYQESLNSPDSRL